jgi:HD superfamily phosphohydrolase YqeK
VSAAHSSLPAWACVTPARMEHIERVAALAERWAESMRVSDAERGRWLRAVWLHDALRDAPPSELERWAGNAAGGGELLHGPASAARAAADGESDQGILNAVRYHSVGWAKWDMAGRVLYCADYLEPGRPFAREWRAEQAGKFPADPTAVLHTVARERIEHVVQSGWPLIEPTVGFWNSLVAASGSR